MTDPSFQAASADVRRQVVRLCGIHTQTSLRIASDAIDQDLVSTIMFLAISRHNLRDITLQAQASGAYSGLGDIPPNALRRPISVYALAKELELPYETARRHANKLVTAGLCDRSEDGLLIPREVYDRSTMQAAVETNWHETLRFIEALAVFGVRAPSPPATRPGPADVRRQVLRVSVEFLLDSLSLLTGAIELDFLGALLAIAITRANTQHLTEDPAAPYASLNEMPPDDLRRPVSVYALARTLRLPYETTRRHAGQLVAAGLCDRTPGGGLIVPLRVVAIPSLMRGVEINWRTTQRYLTTLAELGVTAA